MQAGHRGAPPQRNWTPTRADIAAYVDTELPDLTDAEAACWTHRTAMGQSPTQTARCFHVTVQTVRQHEDAAAAKLMAFAPIRGTHTPIPRRAAPPTDDWDRLDTRLAEIEAEHEDLAGLMGETVSEYDDMRPVDYDQWELELLNRRDLPMLRGYHYEAEFLLRQPEIKARMPPSPRSTPTPAPAPTS